MRLDGMRSLLFGAVAILMAGAIAGCDNPFDPLSKSDKIQGLTYFDFSATQERWDSDPESDGLAITMSYYNEFGDQLNFHDKPHKITIEFWSAATIGEPAITVRGSFLISKTVDFSNSDDVIRIPIEYYAGTLSLPSTEPITGYLLVRVFPPQEYPKRELYFIQSDVEFYTPEPDLAL